MKKGFTLVEVLVSIFIFSLVLVTTLSTYLLSISFEKRQSEYIYFETICLDINKYSDVYKREWNLYYFNNDSNVQYYDINFNYVGTIINKYKLAFFYTANNELIINVTDEDNNRFIIKDLNYGGTRYEEI